jgi:hypothetical protein
MWYARVPPLLSRCASLLTLARAKAFQLIQTLVAPNKYKDRLSALYWLAEEGVSRELLLHVSIK